MKKLRNWDNKTWLSSKSYISQFNKFLKTKINFNKNSKILDIGCGRANIISALQKKYKFRGNNKFDSKMRLGTSSLRRKLQNMEKRNVAHWFTLTMLSR